MKISSISGKKSSKKIIPGSRVSIAVLLDYISEGSSLVEFLADYPWIKKQSVQKVLKDLKSEKYPASYVF